jgi:predicted metal-dependent HD superfamily phosphohydrolase
MTCDEELLRAWDALCTRADLRGASEVGAALLGRYREPHRRYHTTEHLLQVIRLLSELQADDRLQLAAWFHDAVYDPARADNEARSAALARECLQAAAFPSTQIDFVCGAVMATAGHAVERADFHALLDADLAILGASPAAYAAYRDGIRYEYRAVPDEQFRAGRRAFLESMLRRPALYRSAICRERFDVQAKRNLQAELDALQ